MLWFSLPLGAATNSVAGTAGREGILELLISSGDLLDVYFFDQSKYLPSGLGEVEQDAAYFWIFRNLDYEKWVKREVKILVLHGPSRGDLELAVSHIARSLRGLDNLSQEGDVLYFFFKSIRRELAPSDAINWHESVCVWNLLRQMIGNLLTTLQKQLLRAFLRKALHSLSDDNLAKLRGYDPTEAFKSILHLSEPQHLWDALGRVLGEMADSGEQEYPGRQREPNLTLIIDLNRTGCAGKSPIDNICQMATALQQDYGTVRVLLSNVPETADPWQPRQSEILLEYDRGRKGMYGPQIRVHPTIIVGLLIRFPIFWIR